ncbi:MAG UNVERIFIED_CONTAM: hypothetical protein LVR18_35860 [Planctomycetaceae bacterium]|jgi:MFS family permease
MKQLILFLLCLMAVIAYVQRAAISVPEKQVAENLQLSDPIIQMGWVQSAWYLGYALLQMPAGRLADRWRLDARSRSAARSGPCSPPVPASAPA